MTISLFRHLIALIFLLQISACQHGPEQLRLRAAEFMHDEHEFKMELVESLDFVLTTWQKIKDPKKPFVFYVEGDGHTFESYGMPAVNPTPHGMTMMNLAVLDTRPNVVYIARPCQFTPMELNPECKNFYWIQGRMSEPVIKSVANAINLIADGSEVHLIGFSGGGGVVALVSALGLVSPESIISVAGNLDHEAFTAYHQARKRAIMIPLSGSLNPIDYTDKLKKIPQLCLSGTKDVIVPPEIAESFVAKQNSNCAKHRVIEGATHSKGWSEVWREIIARPVRCE